MPYFQGLGKDGWSSIWPNNPWYAPYPNAGSERARVLPNHEYRRQRFRRPRLLLGPATLCGKRSASRQARPEGSHYLKYGFQFRRGGGPVFVSNTNKFYFNQPLTANTFNSPDLTKSGDPFATFLLGALDDHRRWSAARRPSR